MGVIVVILAMLFLAGLQNEAYECASGDQGASYPAQTPGSCAITNRVPITPPADFPAAPESNYTEDLVAQQWIAWSAFWMLFITTFGVAVIATTVLLSGRGLEVAKLSTKAAQLTLKQSEYFGRIEHQAHLTSPAIEVSFYRDSKTPWVPIVETVRMNVGRTPAKSCAFEFDITLMVDDRTVLFETLKSGTEVGPRDIDPGQRASIQTDSGVKSWERWLSDWENLSAQIIVLVRGKYKTVFDEEFLITEEHRTTEHISFDKKVSFEDRGSYMFRLARISDETRQKGKNLDEN